MSSEPISFNPARLRAAAAANHGIASDYADYRSRCQEWLNGVEAEIERCNGVIAAPVGRSLREFFGHVSDRAAVTVARRAAMGDNLVAAAGRYERSDFDGAAHVRGGGAVGV